MNAAHEPPRVTVITGASQGIGAGVAPGCPEPGSLSSIPPADVEDYLTFQGDIAHAKTAQRVTDRAHDRSGRIDTLVNKPGSTAATRNAPPSSSDPSYELNRASGRWAALPPQRRMPFLSRERGHSTNRNT